MRSCQQRGKKSWPQAGEEGPSPWPWPCRRRGVAASLFTPRRHRRRRGPSPRLLEGWGERPPLYTFRLIGGRGGGRGRIAPKLCGLLLYRRAVGGGRGREAARGRRRTDSLGQVRSAPSKLCTCSPFGRSVCSAASPPRDAERKEPRETTRRHEHTGLCGRLSGRFNNFKKKGGGVLGCCVGGGAVGSGSPCRRGSSVARVLEWNRVRLWRRGNGW